MAASAMDAEPSSSVDIEAYASLYSGRTRGMRLLFAAERGGPGLELDALRLAATYLKQGEDTQLYAQAIDKVGGRLGAGFTLDKAWVEATEKRAAQKCDRLEADLAAAKAGSVKEGVRMGHMDLGDFYSARGDLQNAFKCYVRARDYCTTGAHVVAMCLAVIRVAAELNNFTHVANYVQKAETTPEATADALTSAKLKAAAGLALLEQKKYKLAARKFCEAPPDLGAEFSDVLAAQDVALYGGLAALASFDRAELKTRVIDNIAFRSYLELLPEVRELINDFYASRYNTCLAALDRLRAALAVDVHAHDHAGALCDSIRQRAIAAYCAPFTSVRLASMAAALNTTLPALDKELATLIGEERVAARIDSAAGVLYARHADARKTTFQRALAAGEAYQRDTKALLVRASLMQHDVVQKGARREGGHGHGGGHGGGGGGGGGHGPHGRGGDAHFHRMTADRVARAHAHAGGGGGSAGGSGDAY